jgi:hypothetical protein
MSLNTFRSQHILHQAIRKFDLPLTASFWAVSSGTVLMFFLGAALGGVAVTQGLEPNTIIFTFVAIASLSLLALAASLCYYWEIVSERREALTKTLENYMDVEIETAKISAVREVEEGALRSARSAEIRRRGRAS